MPVLDSCPGEPEDPLWMLSESGIPRRLPKTARVFLEACTFKVAVPTNVEQVKKRRFAEIGRVSELLKEEMRENLALSLASIVEAAGFAGDFRILSRSRSWNPVLPKAETCMELKISIAMCGCFMDGLGSGWPTQREWDVWPSPRRIFSKIRNLELAARISKEMTVQDVMSA